MPESQIQITRPFGPSIAKVQMPDELVKTLNKYVDDIIADDEKSKKQDWGHKLAGHVKQEFVLAIAVDTPDTPTPTTPEAAVAGTVKGTLY